MSAGPESVYDLLVLGSGPAGQKAAIQGAKAGRRVLIVEQEPTVGGACVHRGTIPSKTLRETAAALAGFRRRCGGVVPVELREDLQLASLMTRLQEVVRGHEATIADQLQRNGVEVAHGRARFLSPHEVEIGAVTGARRRVRSPLIVIATGSRPRDPRDVPVDHDHVLDSDSILSLTYLPASLTVLGAGVIASEYASIFTSLGVRVTMIEKGERPLAFLDPELTQAFVEDFERAGGRFLGRRRVQSVAWDGASSVITTLEGGEEVRSEKLLFTLGRVANVEGLHLEAAGLAPNDRGVISVDAHCRTAVSHIYAVGDVIGPPSLAASSMEQGRRAMRHALGLDLGPPPELTPAGIYTIPEISAVGLSEPQAIEREGSVLVGRARFEELARGQIAAAEKGLLKLVADGSGRRLLGVQIIGEGACELIHVGQMALLAKADVEIFVDNVFNFPTLAEGYRVAALDIARKRARAPCAVG